jgi:hypothetical protein
MDTLRDTEQTPAAIDNRANDGSIDTISKRITSDQSEKHVNVENAIVDTTVNHHPPPASREIMGFKWFLAMPGDVLREFSLWP